jgi:hypothetical protein
MRPAVPAKLMACRQDYITLYIMSRPIFMNKMPLESLDQCGQSSIKIFIHNLHIFRG